MRRLVVVSNRCKVPRRGEAPGGLAVALGAALRDSGGLWFGWDGNVTDFYGRKAELAHVGGIDYATISLPQDAYEDYYKGYANRVLWPLCHYRVDAMQFETRYREGYRRTNDLLVRKLLPLLVDDDRVWVHDYHLIPMGRALRAAGIALPLGFFLHVPFPSYDVLRTLPHHGELLCDLLAYDLVGFQSADDCRNFLDCVARGVGAQVEAGGTIRRDGHACTAGVFPISIDPREVRDMITSARETRTVRRLEQSLRQRPLVIGVDRLDYSKGLPERFRTYQRLLAKYPETNGNVVFLQVAQPSREDVPEYRALRTRLERIVGEINGQFADFDWVPIRYVNKSYARATIMNFLSIARVGLVTPLRDGMNLVAKEFVIAQSQDDPGVLILSELAGAAHELDSALKVNPYDHDAVADALLRALKMPLEERRERWAAARDVILGHDVFAWARAFLETLERGAPA